LSRETRATFFVTNATDKDVASDGAPLLLEANGKCIRAIGHAASAVSRLPSYRFSRVIPVTCAVAIVSAVAKTWYNKNAHLRIFDLVPHTRLP